MRVTWDQRKAKANQLKHRIFLSDAEGVLYDPNALSCYDPDAEGEERFIATGCNAFARILTIIYTYRDDEVRLISARKATKKEKSSYESRI